MATTVNIPARNFVDVSIGLTTPVAPAVNFQRALLLSDEPGFVRYMMDDATGTYPGGGNIRTITITGTASLNALRRSIEQYYRNPSPTPPFTDEERNLSYTYDYIQTYLDQQPAPPVLAVAYVDRTLYESGDTIPPDRGENDPHDFYWEVVTDVANLSDVYHVFYVGNQAQLLDDNEGIALCGYFDSIPGIIYTSPSGTMGHNVPAAPRPLINHLMCGHDANIGPIVTTPVANDLARMLTVNSAEYTRTQLYWPDSPTGVIEGMTPGEDVEVDFYSNAVSAAVVGQLCSGSRFNRAPGALSTANLSNIQAIRVVGDRAVIVGTRDGNMMFVESMPPDINQVEVSAETDRNLLFYVQTTSPNVRFTYKLGSCPNEAVNDSPTRYLDQTIAIDWLQQEIVEEYLNVVVNAGPLRFTNEDLSKIRHIIEKVFERGKRLRILNPGFGPADGEIISIPDVDELTPEERQSRELTSEHPITFVTQLAESLNSVTIIGTVQP